MESHDTKSCPVVPTDISTLKVVGMGVAVTTRVVEPPMEPILAAMTVCPLAWPAAKPLALMVATAGEEEFQSALLVQPHVDPGAWLGSSHTAPHCGFRSLSRTERANIIWRKGANKYVSNKD
jgi:hypothetical protein